jgi:hypothetical protein
MTALLAVQVLILAACVIALAVLRWRDRDLLRRRRP